MYLHEKLFKIHIYKGVQAFNNFKGQKKNNQQMIFELKYATNKLTQIEMR